MLGTRLSELGLSFDLMLTSPQKRAILSMKHLRDTYTNAAEIPCKIMTQIHEELGVNMGGQTFPGLPRSQILSLLPEL